MSTLDLGSRGQMRLIPRFQTFGNFLVGPLCWGTFGKFCQFTWELPLITSNRNFQPRISVVEVKIGRSRYFNFLTLSELDHFVGAPVLNNWTILGSFANLHGNYP